VINLDKLSYGYQAIDKCHLYLIQGLLVSAKPKAVLELGVGTGNVSQVILQALSYNGWGKLTCVDNWQDWKGKQPPIAAELVKSGADVVTMSERDYVRNNTSTKFDFIMSDGAHGASHLWCDALYDMLRPNGYLVAHDVTNRNFQNLKRYITEAKSRKYSQMLYQTSSREDERCERGLLIVTNC
jgi:predicted O-methyltransferase YrrM